MASLRPVPQLDPPGAGLPPLEAWASRHVALPLARALLPWDAALAWFAREGARILDHARGMDNDSLICQVLISRVPGIEDSSRHWSAAMVLDHLMMVGNRIADGVESLARGDHVLEEVSIAAVKPVPRGASGMLADFEAFLAAYLRRMGHPALNRRSRTTLVHPWFGPLDPRGWNLLGALHQHIHRRQLERIIAALGEDAPAGA